MESPKVTIVIPVYNGSNYLKEAIDSALSQTYHNIEIIVVNDGSNDNGATEQIALSYGEKIRYLKKENGGSSSALNYGIQNMQGDYFAWLSHDDIYKEQKIQLMVEKLNPENKKHVVICGFELIDSAGKHIPYPKKQLNGEYHSLEMFRCLKNGYGINGCAILVSKQLMEETGFFDESFRYVNDTDYWYRLLTKNATFSCFDDSLVKTRMHNEQVSVKKADLYRIENKILSQKILDILCMDMVENEKKISVFLVTTARNGYMDVVCSVLKKTEINCLKKKFYLIYLYGYFIYGYFLEKFKTIYKKIFFKR